MDQITYFAVSGNNFKIGKQDLIRKVLVGGRSSEFDVISDKIVIVKVAPWEEREAFNADNRKTEMVIITEKGVALTPEENKIYFDIKKSDSAESGDDELSEEDKKLQKVLNSLLKIKKEYGEGVGLKTDIRFTTSLEQKSGDENNEDAEKPTTSTIITIENRDNEKEPVDDQKDETKK